jgi:predicted lipid-binding transport protein (Tim44 family)
MTASRVPPIDVIYVIVIGGLLAAAAISALKFQEAQTSIERRSQIGMALTDSYVAERRNAATDRERPEAAAKADAAIAEAATTNELSGAHDAKPARNRKARRSTTKRYADRDRLVNGGW